MTEKWTWFATHLNQLDYSRFEMLIKEAETMIQTGEGKISSLIERFRELMFTLDFENAQEGEKLLDGLFYLMNRAIVRHQETSELLLAAKKSFKAKHIVKVLVENGSIYHDQLAAELKISKSNLSNHLKRLTTYGLFSVFFDGSKKWYSITSKGLIFYEHMNHSIVDIVGKKEMSETEVDVRDILKSRPFSSRQHLDKPSVVPDRVGAKRKTATLMEKPKNRK